MVPVFFHKTISVLECETPAGKTIKIILPINLFDHKNEHTCYNLREDQLKQTVLGRFRRKIARYVFNISDMCFVQIRIEISSGRSITKTQINNALSREAHIKPANKARYIISQQVKNLNSEKKTIFRTMINQDDTIRAKTRSSGPLTKFVHVACCQNADDTKLRPTKESNTINKPRIGTSNKVIMILMGYS
ncbi:hypothetical protein TcasGA2_TC000778 [Tribolium castaneum]|uniref:Uncharacterized protein n=1 Tax=Tribolium castaneum TaxID=7070 RepID=D6WD34_TRICA|nr:hypothetical protein TcasGA2_TC000778 [Tribolium castaneum]